jgi:hypothetical protein
MQFRRLISLAFLFLAIGLSAQVQPSPKTVVERELVGSVPPVTEWYACMNRLRDKPFDRSKADACLNSILSHPELTSGKLLVKPQNGYTEVTFVLKSPVLTLATASFGLPRELEADFEKFVGSDEDVLRVNSPYDMSKEQHTTLKLEQFFSSQAQAAIVSEDLALDYRNSTANLKYRIWEGPQIPPEHPLLPGPPQCGIYVKDVNETNLDDYTPLALLNKTLALRRTPCFSELEIKNAEKELNDTGLFSTLEIKTSDSGEWRSVSVTARTKPTTVKQIVYRFYGALADESGALPELPLAKNQVYTRSAVLRTRDLLLETFRKPAMTVKVYEDETLTEDHQLSVTFHILAAKPDTLSIDGKPIK